MMTHLPPNSRCSSLFKCGHLWSFPKLNIFYFYEYMFAVHAVNNHPVEQVHIHNTACFFLTPFSFPLSNSSLPVFMLVDIINLSSCVWHILFILIEVIRFLAMVRPYSIYFSCPSSSSLTPHPCSLGPVPICKGFIPISYPSFFYSLHLYVALLK